VSSDDEFQFGREVCADLDAAESREWLVTNGIGGYASGTVAGTNTRRYHGLLMAALQPPVGRTQLVATLDETVHYAGTDFPLATHRWASGAVDPQGFSNIDGFHLEGTKPVWTFVLADALLEKRVWMRHGANTTYVQYALLRGSRHIEMELKAMVNYRDYHSSTHADNWQMKIEPVQSGVKILAFDGAVPFFLKCVEATCEVRGEWYRDCYLPAESTRGLDDREDHLFAATFNINIQLGDSVTFVLSTQENESLDSESARSDLASHEVKLFQNWQQANSSSGPHASSRIRQLVLAADQFIVKRTLPDQTDGRTIIAGYHWFADWGRDTMIALPGLTLATGRAEVARQILLAFARFVDGGMLPNNFPDSGGQPEYNTVDATLWYFEALRQYYEETQDGATLLALFPVLANIVDAHIQGTRYNIHVDPADGLLFAGVPGVQLTWMDAKIGDWVVTPRTGKPVEINALWINALETFADFAQLLAKPFERYAKLATQSKKNFQRFWNADRHCCFDVIDVPGSGVDAAVRPNQIFAVSLPVSPLNAQQQKSVVDTCAQQLLVPYGLRSLAPGEPGYRGSYEGGPRERDAAYHQGTAWGWLLGPFVQAHFRVYNDLAAAVGYLEPLASRLLDYGLGTLGEIFDGDAPFASRGCIAQAWTVGEVLRAWRALHKA
jgi:predicted glycogen debranching enzyme